jgi:hypothetical protein
MEGGGIPVIWPQAGWIYPVVLNHFDYKAVEFILKLGNRKSHVGPKFRELQQMSKTSSQMA